MWNVCPKQSFEARSRRLLGAFAQIAFTLMRRLCIAGQLGREPVVGFQRREEREVFECVRHGINLWI